MAKRLLAANQYGFYIKDTIPNLHWMVPLYHDNQIAGPICISEVY